MVAYRFRLLNRCAKVRRAALEEASQWDGLHGIITNDHEESASKLLDCYRGLWQIEESFRVQKHDLKMRPIYHWTPRRIRAHVLLCFLAFAVTKQTLWKLKSKKISTTLSELRSTLQGIEQHRLFDITTQKRVTIQRYLVQIT